MKTIFIPTALAYVLTLGCEPSPAVKEAQRKADSIHVAAEKSMDSLMLDFIRLGYSIDQAMMETHGSTYHRGDCEKYKEWKRELDGR